MNAQLMLNGCVVTQNKDTHNDPTCHFNMKQVAA
jgi:hypothetical protein